MFLRTLIPTSSHIFKRMINIPASQFRKVEDFQEIADSFFEFTEVEKDGFSPKILKNARQGHQSAAYGGLVFAQALAAAEKTVEEKFKPHSMHSYFINNVDTRHPINYLVKRVRDGRSFVTRTVEAVQNEKIAFVLQASFHVKENESIVHQSEIPNVPEPETLPSMRDAVPLIKEKVEKGEISPTPAMLRRLQRYDAVVYSDDADLFEMRSTNLGNYYGYDSDKKTELFFWMRTRGDLNNDERLHRLLVAYNSDSLLVSTAVSPHFATGFLPSMMFSLDHCVWFHNTDFRADEWLLFETRSHIASGSRTFIEGKIWKKDGTLVASCHQEALIRSKDVESRL